MPSPLHCGIRSSSFQLVRAEPRTLKLCTGIAAFHFFPKPHMKPIVPLFMTSAALASHLTEWCSEKNYSFDWELDIHVVFSIFFIICTLIQYFGCISCYEPLDYWPESGQGLAVVAQRQWHPPCNSKWNRNTLLQINVCFQLCKRLNWQTRLICFMAYFVSYFYYFEIKAPPFFWQKCVFGQLQYLASCGLCSQLMLLVVQDSCLKKFVIYWFTFYEVL